MIKNLSQFDFTDIWTLVVFPLFPITCWSLCLYLSLRRRHPIPLENRKEVPWGAIDVITVLGSMLLAKFISQFCAVLLIAWKTGSPIDQIDQQTAIEQSGILVGTGIFFSILQLIFAVWYLKTTQGGKWADLGLSLDRWRIHLATGAVAALMVIPLVLLLNIVLHTVLKVEYTHQVMDMVRYSLLVSAASTILIAPVVEEFHFRVVLQGFLQRIQNVDLEKKVRLIQGDQRTNKLGLGKAPEGRQKGQKKTRQDQQSVPWWPLLVSSFLFASVHMGQGAAPYALFVFALFLGFLYRQTNSIIPCIMVHLLLNLWSFIALVYSLD